MTKHDEQPDTHPAFPAQPQSGADAWPKVLVCIIALNVEPTLDLYLQCIEELDYPKDRIVVYIRTAEGADLTHLMLSLWGKRLAHAYAHIDFDASASGETFGSLNERTDAPTQDVAMACAHNLALRKTREYGCDYYFSSSLDNFLRPSVLGELVRRDLPIVAPFLRALNRGARYSNFYADIDDYGYYKESPNYDLILLQSIKGLFELPVVHGTYLVRADVLTHLTFEDGTPRHSYVIFSDSARQAGIPQYLDNRQVYGYVSSEHTETASARGRELLGNEISVRSNADAAVRSQRLARIMARADQLRAIDEKSPDENQELEFINFCRCLDDISNSQLWQDAWVLFELRQKRGGYFVEFGACDGIYLSNSLTLEQHYGWRGALAEPSPVWREALIKNRTSYVSTRCIYGVSGEVVEFRQAEDCPVLSTINEFVDSDMNAWARKNGKLVLRETVSLLDFLAEARSPRDIDYLSMDTEGSELAILENFDFDAYNIRLISVEHNYTSQRAPLQELLARNGYRRRFEAISANDDWYTRF